MRGDAALLILRARAQGGLEDPFHGTDEGLVGIVEQQAAARPQQMRETRLMQRVGEVPIRLPAVADQHAGIVVADDRRGLREPAARLNGVDRGQRRRDRPQPLQIGVDAPARLVHRDDRTAAHGGGQMIVGRLGDAGGALHRLHQAAARHREAEAVAQQRRDFARGQAAPFVEQHGEGDRVWAELHGGGAERIRGLQGMAALQAPLALRAATDVHVKGADDRPLRRQVFLILPRDTLGAHRARALRADRGQRRLVGLVDPRRRPAGGAHAIRRARLAAGPSRLRDPRAARKGRGLAIHRSPSGIELVFQLLVFAPQPLALRFRSPKIFTEPFDFACLIFDDLLRVTGTIIRSAIRHADVMPEPRLKYKYGILNSQR